MSLTLLRLAREAIRLRKLVRGLEVVAESNGTVTFSATEWYELVEAASPERARYHEVMKEALSLPSGQRPAAEFIEQAKEALKVPPPDDVELQIAEQEYKLIQSVFAGQGETVLDFSEIVKPK